MEVRTITVGPLQENCYLLRCRETGSGVIVDPGAEAERIAAEIEAMDMQPLAILLTHAHVDHIGAVPVLKSRLGVPLRMHEAAVPVYRFGPEAARMYGLECPAVPEPDEFLAEGDAPRFGNIALEVLHTPGHSPGSVCLVHRESKLVFCGDVLFAGSVGRTDLPGGDPAVLGASIRGKLFALDDDFTACPGHGPRTTIGTERRQNPFVGEHAAMPLG